MINDSGKLKGLKTRRSDLLNEITQLRDDYSHLKRKIDSTQGRINKIDKEIEDMTEVEPVITEHAILKYIERVMGFDLDNVRSEILNESTLPMVKSMKSGKFPLHDGHKIVAKNMSIVTVI